MNKQEEESGEFSVFTLGKATKYLLDLVVTVSDEGALKYVSDYYTLCVYRGAISVEDAKFVFIEDKSRTGSDLGEKTALHSLIENAENIIYNTFVLE